jgi:hypothetical protein
MMSQFAVGKIWRKTRLFERPCQADACREGDSVLSKRCKTEVYIEPRHGFLMPPIPDSERTPLVIALLGVIEGLAERMQKKKKKLLRRT